MASFTNHLSHDGGLTSGVSLEDMSDVFEEAVFDFKEIQQADAEF
jgi:hypothetical protein